MTTFDQPAIDFDEAEAPKTTLVSGISGISSTTATTPEGYHWQNGRCPNMGNACNCPGYCRPKLVKDEPIDFDAVSAPIEGETLATVQLVGNDWRSEADWKRFESACRYAALPTYPYLDPNNVRACLTNAHGLTIEPRRYSAFWSRAAGKNGFLVADGWVTNEDVKGGNRGKPLRRYRLRP